jgi:L-2-hydroxyglutarate oxidase LhgO
MKRSFDILIVGAGIIGLTIARALRKRGYKHIGILEKEAELGQHASGRNSGVLHAGIYYATDSLKARFCSVGSRLLQEYAAENAIPFKRTGKVIVVPSPEQLPQIDILFERAKTNGIRVEKIDVKQLMEIEPEAKTHEVALLSPDTAVIDSMGVLKTLEKELESLGVLILKSEKLHRIDAEKQIAITGSGSFAFGHLINAAGLYADKIAHWMGVGRRYRILPFKGIYHKLDHEKAKRFRGAIYPVPDLRFPFLGVHVTRTVADEVIVGPTAMPALGRENYGMFDGIHLSDLLFMARDLAIMGVKNTDGFRSMVIEELNKYRRSGFVKCVRAIVPSVKERDLMFSGKVGLRAQLVDEREMKLVTDFIVQNGLHSTHVLNAVSPAFTCSFAFAEFVTDKAIDDEVSYRSADAERGRAVVEERSVATHG